MNRKYTNYQVTAASDEEREPKLLQGKRNDNQNVASTVGSEEHDHFNLNN